MSSSENEEAVAKREQYPAKYKLRVISYAESNGNRSAGRKFQVSERNVRRWRLDKHRLQHCPATQRSFRGPKAGKLSFIETELAEYVIFNRRKGIKVNWSMIATKARVLATAYGVSHDKFRASRGWMNRFMARQGLSSRGPNPLPTRYPFFPSVRDKKRYSPSQVGIVCQMPLYFDEPAEFLDMDEACGYRNSDVVNVVLSCTADGQKLPLYIGFNQKSTDVSDVSLFRSDVQVGYVCRDKDVLHNWAQKVWLKQGDPLATQHSILIIDSKTAEFLDSKVHRVLVDRQTTLREAPTLLDGVCSNFLSVLSAIYTDWIVGEGLWRIRKTATLSHIADWIALAWLSVQRSLVQRAFVDYDVGIGAVLEEDSAKSHSPQLSQDGGARSVLDGDPAKLAESNKENKERTT
ncbi:transposon, putative [Ixodes scapularis]|uniref:Transposon, putative n=1 Tax=Ixodes scapularis TaxID=6945 RepID=B7QJQ6_IXOSC|nr:transposon, putative [Ixodes scapularis]|eukprot:XP_002415413.1 transposon, putative [Ixodes scapularis]